jgi:dTDP-4-amino-4,6-dideoxygalactose transaminase
MQSNSESIIGGEFDINPCLIKTIENGNNSKFKGSFYSSGRAALYNILCYISAKKNEIKKIYLPDYLCHSISDVVKLFKFEVCHYPVLPNLEVDIDYFTNYSLNTSVVMVINYFGGIDSTKVISALKQSNPAVCIIENNVQALYAMFNETMADFSFTSFRKQLPVPDGGWVKSKYSDLPNPIEKNTFATYKIAGGILKKYRKSGCIDDIYLELFKKGEDLIDFNLKSEMSEITSNIVLNIDLDSIANKRKKNVSYLLKHLQKMEISPIVDFLPNMVPLFVPIKIKNRDEVRKLLFKNNIFCPIHWTTENDKLKRGYEMSKNELSLIIDQRYDYEDIDKIIHILKQSGDFCY